MCLQSETGNPTKRGLDCRLYVLPDQMGKHPIGVALFISHFVVFRHLLHFNGSGAYYTDCKGQVLGLQAASLGAGASNASGRFVVTEPSGNCQTIVPFRT